MITQLAFYRNYVDIFFNYNISSLIQCHCFRLNATQYILSFFSFPLSQHVSTLLGHLQVLITMLNCHTVLVIILATLFRFSLTHTRIVYIKFVYTFILKIIIKILFHKMIRL
jgi:hypothetical protein